MRTPARKGRLGLRIAEEEILMLNRLAVDAGVSASDIVRLLIREAYRLKHGTKAPKGRRE